MTLVLTFLAFSRRVGARENLPTFIAVIGERAGAQCREEDGVDGVCKYAGQGWDNTITEQSDEYRGKNESQEDLKRDVSAISTSNLVVIMVTIIIITIVIVIIMTILTMHMRFIFGQICLGSVVSDALNQRQAKQPQS